MFLLGDIPAGPRLSERPPGDDGSTPLVEVPGCTTPDSGPSSSTPAAETKDISSFVRVVILSACLASVSVMLLIIIIYGCAKKHVKSRRPNIIYTGSEMGIFNSVFDDTGV
jgi:hypothetical protein